MSPIKFTRGTQSLYDSQIRLRIRFESLRLRRWKLISGKRRWKIVEISKEYNECRRALLVAGTLGLHQFDGQSEESTCFIANHLEIIILTRTGQGISPEEIHPLAPM